MSRRNFSPTAWRPRRSVLLAVLWSGLSSVAWSTCNPGGGGISQDDCDQMYNDKWICHGQGESCYYRCDPNGNYHLAGQQSCGSGCGACGDGQCTPNIGTACNRNACGGTGTIQCGGCSAPAPTLHGSAPCGCGGATDNCTGACGGQLPMGLGACQTCSSACQCAGGSCVGGVCGPCAAMGTCPTTCPTCAINWTDSTLCAAGDSDPACADRPATNIRAIHFTELRDCINMKRGLWPELSSYPWSEALTPETTRVRAIHVSEMRKAIADVYAQTGAQLPFGAWTDSTVYSSAQSAPTGIRKIHIKQLRQAVEGAPHP